MPLKHRTPPAVGDTLGNEQLTRSDGTHTTLSALADGGMVLVFIYRGSWCAFCLRQLADYRDRMKQLDRMGVKFVAISTDTQSVTTRLQRLLKLPFELFSDAERALISKWDLLNVRDIHSAFPATLLIDATLNVRFATFDDGYAAATADAVLAQCKTIAEGDKPVAPPSLVFRIPGIGFWLRAMRNEIALRSNRWKTGVVTSPPSYSPQAAQTSTHRHRLP